VVALGPVPAPAQDYTAGKTPPQLFASDCAACHKSPQGLGRGKDASSLTSFLREHYTTKPSSAGALAGYLVSVAGSSGGVRRPATDEQPRQAARPKPASEGAAKPEEEQAPRRKPRAAAGEEARPAARSSGEPGAAEGEHPARRPRAARATEEPKPHTGEREAPARARRTAAPAGEPDAEGAKPVGRTLGTRVREKPMTPAERLKSYSSAGENAKAAEEQQGEAKAKTAGRLEGYANSGADADAVGRSGNAAPGQGGRPAKSRKRNRAAEAQQSEGTAAPAAAAPPAANPTAPSAGGAPDPTPPAAEEKK
jgi:hypothetical protein